MKINKCTYSNHFDVYFFMLLYTLMPIIDSINGYVLLELQMNLSIGSIYRVLLIICAFYFTIKYKCHKNDFRFFLCLISVPALSMLAHIMLIHNSIGEEMKLFIQWEIIPIFVYTFILLKRNNLISIEDVYHIINFYCWIVPITIILPKLIGRGFFVYAGEIGYKGFYYANNGISFVVSVLVIYSWVKVIEDFKIGNILTLVMLTWSCLMLGTKSCVLSICIGCGYAIYLLITKNTIKNLKLLVLLVIGIFFGILIFDDFIAEKIGDVITRFNVMNAMYDDSILTTISSGRTLAIDRYVQMLSNDYTILFEILFGFGNKINIEMDFIDMFFKYGLLGIFAMIILIIYIQTKIKVDKKNKFIIIFCIVYAFIVGHVFNNSMSSMMFVVILMLNELRKKTVMEAVQ